MPTNWLIAHKCSTVYNYRQYYILSAAVTFIKQSALLVCTCNVELTLTHMPAKCCICDVVCDHQIRSNQIKSNHIYLFQ